MDVFISADIEGCTGLVSWGQAMRPSADQYDWPYARRMMTHDVNAAVRGARAAGAQRVLVKDSHGDSRNLLVDQLEPGVELISGLGAFPLGMVSGLDTSFACVFLVGYHAMAGTPDAVMEHTITGAVHRLWVNGTEWGEMAMASASAGALGIPVTLVTSDEKGCTEASSFLSAETVAVKAGLGRYEATLRPSGVTSAEIEAAASRAVGLAEKAKPFIVEPPVHVRLEQHPSECAEAAATVPGWRRVDGFTVEAQFSSWPEAVPSLWRAMMVGAAATRWNG